MVTVTTLCWALPEHGDRQPLGRIEGLKETLLVLEGAAPCRPDHKNKVAVTSTLTLDALFTNEGQSTKSWVHPVHP